MAAYLVASAWLWLGAACSEARDETSTSADDSPAKPTSGAAPTDIAPTDIAPTLDRETALSLVAMPLSCLDRPHALPPDRTGYLDDLTFARRRGFDSERAFYGCWDWHSAVNSTWAMVRVLKERPELPVGPLIREKLRDHLSVSAMEGELAYLTANPAFERPYGWAWLLLLHAEMASWDVSDAATWADRLAPLADLLAGRLGEYLRDLPTPERRGTHPNTAFAIAASLQATASFPRPELEELLGESAVRLFAADRDCPTAYEPGRSDFVSPCLEEAALMASVMETDTYRDWLDDFLPAPDSEAFANLRNPTPAGPTGTEPLPEGGAVVTSDSLRAVFGARSHLIGLAFTRAEAMLRIAAALPPADDRAASLRQLADDHARAGFESMFDADYAGSHWIGSFAVKYFAARAETSGLKAKGDTP